MVELAVSEVAGEIAFQTLKCTDDEVNALRAEFRALEKIKGKLRSKIQR